MRDPHDILLIACYELGHQPLALASPLAWLREAGHKATAIDLSIESLDDESIRRAKFIAISVPMHTALRIGEGAARRIRAINTQAHICFYGHYAWLNRDWLLEIGDSIIAGEYEEPLLNLIRAIEIGDRRLEIDGVTTRAHDSDPYLRRLRFITPQRSTLPPLQKYAHYIDGDDHRIAGYTEATRGCLHTCLHCPITPIYNGRFFIVPFEVVMADIRQQVAAGATHITFGDPDFLNGPKHSLKIVRALHDEFPHVTFDFTAKVVHLIEQQESLREFKESGGAFVVSAFESFSDEVLTRLNKGHTRDQIFEAIGIMRRVGIPIRPSLVAFTPWTTLDDYLDLLNCVRDLNLVEAVDPIQFSIRLLVPPHSALLQTFKVFETLKVSNGEHRWLHPDPRMDELHRAVSKRVEEAAATAEDIGITFESICALAYQTAGLTLPAFENFSPPTPIPRLSEAWFC
ncbi:MAG: B12-binding domain-containing radical SAM protein [Chloroflexi bacterium]|nr:B12-binding domain-containing radical SAM protein [Chloroflexota bacterium]